MNDKLTSLKIWGCDIDNALPRFLEDEDFMLECIISVCGDPAFEALGNYLRENNVNSAFEAAHTLKGIIANTGLSPLYSVIVRIVEPLRKGNLDGLTLLYDELIKKRQELSVILAI